MDEIETETPNLSGDLTPQRRTLTGFLDAIETAHDPGAAGGVPVPDEWRCFRAVLGGAERKHLEDAYAAPEMGKREDELRNAEMAVRAAEKEGTHLPPGLHIFTGQTGGGKSALVVNLARGAAKAGHPVLYVTLELDGEEIAARVLALESGIRWSLLALRRQLSPEYHAKREAGRASLREVEKRLTVLAPDGELKLDVLHREAFDLWREHGRVPLVVFDYLQLAPVLMPDNHLPLREAITRVVFELRWLSRRIPTMPDWPGCPVVVLSSTARSNVAGRSDEKSVPGLDGKNPDALRNANLETLKALPKEAGEVEATAVTAWVLALGDKPKHEHGPRALTLRLAKNRLGMPGQWIPFEFHGATGQLTEAPARYAQLTQPKHQSSADGEDSDTDVGRLMQSRRKGRGTK